TCTAPRSGLPGYGHCSFTRLSIYSWSYRDPVSAVFSEAAETIAGAIGEGYGFHIIALQHHHFIIGSSCYCCPVEVDITFTLQRVEAKRCLAGDGKNITGAGFAGTVLGDP